MKYLWNTETFDVGDSVVYRYEDYWIEAKVVHVFPAGSFRYQFRHYVLEVDASPVDYYLDIRPEHQVFNPSVVSKK
jgi:hypothetical protein